jgi:hypothetical protein
MIFQLVACDNRQYHTNLFDFHNLELLVLGVAMRDYLIYIFWPCPPFADNSQVFRR